MSFNISQTNFTEKYREELTSWLQSLFTSSEPAVIAEAQEFLTTILNARFLKAKNNSPSGLRQVWDAFLYYLTTDDATQVIDNPELYSAGLKIIEVETSAFLKGHVSPSFDSDLPLLLASRQDIDYLGITRDLVGFASNQGISVPFFKAAVLDAFRVVWHTLATDEEKTALSTLIEKYSINVDPF